MISNQLRSLICKSALMAAVIAVAPSIQAQNAAIALPGTAAFDALPSAISPALSSASAVPASYRSQTFSTIRIPEENAIKPVREVPVESLPSRRKWLALSIASSAAAEFDAYSTRRSIAAGNVESNPMMRPFAGSPAIYVAIQASPLVMDYVAFKMQSSHNLFLRHLWFIPQTTSTAMSIFAGAHNMSIASR
ncbi:MAG TPA: hypothetical protein VJS43_08070 [Candidatus Acidoferrales bacterium]|nr:hypothetical protein [Candidatus Acidoferrales bacterium]